MNLVDMFLKGQGGQNIDALSRQFNLSQQQTVAALEALMPAFSQGLQRNAADPMGFGAFVQALSSGQNVNYFDNPQAAFNPSGIADGNYILGQLFGSKDLSRAVADHAATTAGVGAATLKQMLPVVASMMMGGLYKKSTGQFAAAGLGGGNVIGDLIEQMMRQGGGQPSAPQQSAPGAGANPWGQILEGMFGGGAAGQQPQGQTNPLGNNPLGKIFEEMMKGATPGGATSQAPTPRSRVPQDDAPQDTAQGQNPFGDNPLGKIFEEMMRGGIPGAATPQAPTPRSRAPQDDTPQDTAQGQNPFGDNPLGQIFGEIFGGGAQQAPAPQAPQPKAQQRTAPPPAPSDNPLKDILGQMFDTGKQANDQYQKGLESIFDQYLRGMDRNR
ncbi:DUF937 domain-containing protein [Phyllobacterium zundukense]|uniref:DUF937 domain-containing protein n=1 Tax=Phyllobacterium zundukense TaxID=1867719 RepID=A0A2N9VRV2_9HYPH|nr:DUF937 domain-containing protein [Phyllobacterium zundukense]ATU92644.1 hypothetical protein BLM14_14170 [Phyllobacterium zundukense]PIO42220.1 hypothetical protein B5P45_24630 [Phyllobacterium zundukense]